MMRRTQVPTAHGPWKLRAQASLSKHGLLAGISADDVDFITWVDTHYGATEDVVATAKMRPDVIRAFNHFTRIKMPENRYEGRRTMRSS